MIVRTLDEIIGGSRHVSGKGWESRRDSLEGRQDGVFPA